MRLQIDWASLIVGSKFTVFVLFYFVFEGNFSKCKPPGGLYLEGRFNGGFFCVTGLGEGVIHGGAYFRKFTVRFLSHATFHGLVFYRHTTCSLIEQSRYLFQHL